MSKKMPFYKELEEEITKSYESSITMQEAEKLAAKFLKAQLLVTLDLRDSDLDARMRKSGLKAIKAAVYQQEATKNDKKPSDTFLQSLVDINEIVQSEQNKLDEAEVNRDLLQNYYNIFREAHIYFRGIGRGTFA